MKYRGRAVTVASAAVGVRQSRASDAVTSAAKRHMMGPFVNGMYQDRFVPITRALRRQQTLRRPSLCGPCRSAAPGCAGVDLTAWPYPLWTRWCPTWTPAWPTATRPRRRATGTCPRRCSTAPRRSTTPSPAIPSWVRCWYAGWSASPGNRRPPYGQPPVALRRAGRQVAGVHQIPAGGAGECAAGRRRHPVVHPALQRGERGPVDPLREIPVVRVVVRPQRLRARREARIEHRLVCGLVTGGGRGVVAQRGRQGGEQVRPVGSEQCARPVHAAVVQPGVVLELPAGQVAAFGGPGDVRAPGRVGVPLGGRGLGGDRELGHPVVPLGDRVAGPLAVGVELRADVSLVGGGERVPLGEHPVADDEVVGV